MKKLFFFICIITLFIAPSVLFAHPLDISSTLLYIYDETLIAETYIHIFECYHLLREKYGITVENNDFKSHEDKFFEYINEHIKIYINGKECELIPQGIPPQKDIEIIYKGLKLQYFFSADDMIKSIKIINTLFIEDFPLQTNKVTVLSYEEPDKAPILYKVLTTRIYELETEIEYDENDYPVVHEGKPIVDTDGDGLSDEEEAIYGTNQFIKDTDGDGYNDCEEVIAGWDPLDPEPGPGQEDRRG